LNQNLKGLENDFKFHPHVTLARVIHVKDKDSLMINLNNLKFETLTINVDCFHLIKSESTSNGPVYDILETFNLT
jgi:2'-5' RNA ligase